MAGETEALKALSEKSGVPGIDLSQVCIRLRFLDHVPRHLAERHLMIPVLVKGDRLFVAMANPQDTQVVSELEFSSGKKVFAYIALRSPLEAVIADAYGLAERGERHYVGPNCPAEIRAKAGAAPAKPPAQPPPPRTGTGLGVPRPAPPREPPPPRRATKSVQLPEETFYPQQGTAPKAVQSAVVVDEAMGGTAQPEVDVDVEIDTAQPMFDQEEAARPAPPPPPQVDSNERTVLVVDDEPDVRRLLVRVFGERGYNVLEAEDGEVALQTVQSNLPDLVVLDAMLPKVHGFEIARRLKDSERYGHIPIVMVSAVYRGWRFAEDVKANYGVDAYVEKPFRVHDVVAAVESALTQSAEPDQRPSEEAARYLEAGIKAYRSGDLDGAVEQLRAGVHADPLAYRVRFHLGLLYGKRGQLYDAIQELETVVSVRGNFFPALKNLAVLYQNAGFRNKAIEMWERSLAVAPDDGTRENIKRHLVAVLH